MAKYHINPKTGNPGLCKAKDNCPFGGADEHYSSKDVARAAYEASKNPFSASNMKDYANEPLLDELKAWVTPGPFGSFLNHPLVQDMFVDAAPGLANRQFLQKKAHAARALENGEYHHYIFLHERPYRLQALQELLAEHEPANPGVLVRSVWTDSENIHQNYEEWREVLSEVGISMEADDLEKFQAMPEELTIYRGCTPEGEEGYSWSLARDKAEWFATRFSRDEPQLMEAKVNKGQVIAYLSGRGEEEIVVLPEHVKRASIKITEL